MKTRTAYQEKKANALQELRTVAFLAEPFHKNDRPGLRQTINDAADGISKDLPYSLTDAQRERITLALQSLACKLHPKK